MRQGFVQSANPRCWLTNALSYLTNLELFLKLNSQLSEYARRPKTGGPVVVPPPQLADLRTNVPCFNPYSRGIRHCFRSPLLLFPGRTVGLRPCQPFARPRWQRSSGSKPRSSLRSQLQHLIRKWRIWKNTKTTVTVTWRSKMSNSFALLKKFLNITCVPLTKDQTSKIKSLENMTLK